MKITSNRIYCPAFTAWVLALFNISGKRLDASHYTQLPLFLHTAIREFPMEKTFLVFSQLEGHKANVLCLCQVLNSLQTGRASWTGQHRQCSCCRHATGSGRRRTGLQRTTPGTNSRGFQGPVLHVQSCKGIAILCSVSPHISGFWRVGNETTKQICHLLFTEVNPSPLSVTRALHILWDLLQRGEYWGFQLFPLTLF